MVRPTDSELTHSQLQIWLGQALNPNSPLYNMAFAIVFEGELRADLFARAWQRVVDDSDALRTAVIEHEGTAVRRDLGTGACSLQRRDFRDGADADAAFADWCAQRCARPLALHEGLVDSVLVQLDDGRTGWYLNQHHLITDAVSSALLYRRVAAEYAALSGAAEPTPEPLPSYYDTAASLQPGAAELTAARTHWAPRLEQHHRATPFYGHDGVARGTASSRLTLSLDARRSHAIDRLSGEPGFAALSPLTSRFALFATLLLAWLHRISGKRDLGFDTPVTGRPTPAAKRSLGLFIEMFPFATAVAAQDTFRDLARRCLEESHALLRHALPGSSSPSAATAGNVVLNYFADGFGDFAGIPAHVDWIHPGHGDAVHAIRLQVHDFNCTGRYTLHFDFNHGALPAGYRERSLAHFEALLDACLDDPDCSLGAVEVLTEEERARRRRLNDTGAVPLPERTVVEMFDARADADADAVALRQGERELTFAMLQRASRGLAQLLIESDVAPGDRVAVLAGRSIETVIAVLAILRARAAYVPVDPRHPSTRIDHVLRDCDPRLVLLGADAAANRIRRTTTAVTIDAAIAAGDGATFNAPGPQLDDLAYLIYTSGSTGMPKGVLIDHAGLADYLLWAERQYVRGESLRFALCTPLTFDLTVTSLFLPLISGGTLEIYPAGDGPVDAAVIDAVEADAVDFIKLTPSHLSLLRRLDLSGSRVSRMVVGGEDFKTTLAAAISAQYADRIEIWNEYGPTEAVVGCIAHRYDPTLDRAGSVPIGVPADHVAVDVLNEELAAVPDGVPGELWLSRFGLARGYHGDDALSAERFHAHPERPGKRRYRSGDRARINEAGELDYLGRIDRQLKVAGHRVEPAEIEAALLSLPGVEQCAVVARRRQTAPGTADDGDPPTRTCVRCGLPSNYPSARLDEADVCNVCRTYATIREQAERYFRTMDDLEGLLRTAAASHEGPYDCMMLLSGGKDSTYALCRLVDMGLRVYAFTLDNGYISDGAKDNIRRVTEQLGVDVEFGSTPAMKAIFRDSLMRFSNVCNGCFKTIYTLSMQRARELGIPVIVTGLSRGQMFETRLTEEMFRGDRFSPEEVDAAVLEARKLYHRVDDEVFRSLDVEAFQDDAIFEQVRIVDFYRYCNVGLDEVYAYLDRKVPWIRPVDTGRSTNCLINDVGIYIHQKERGYHNYALPYSWDVRMGHKRRDAALDELDDDIDTDRVRRILDEIGYDEDRLATLTEQPTLAAFYTGDAAGPPPSVREQLTEILPAPLVPGLLQRVDAIPLTAHGKVDEQALASIGHGATEVARCVPPEGPVEEYLAALWRELLGVEQVGAEDDFFGLGGTSLRAMELMVRLCREFDIDLPLETPFTHPTLRALAGVAEDKILADVAALSAADRRALTEGGGPDG